MKQFFIVFLIIASSVFYSQDTTCLGVGYGGHYNGEQFLNYINDLEISHYFITVKWDWYEPSPGQYQDSIILAFLNQVPMNSEALIRISPRGNTLYNDPATDYTVPLDLSLTSPYYDMFYHIVSLDSGGKIKYYENEWEFNLLKHWGGVNNITPDPIDLGLKYADLTRTTQAAIAAANPNAEFILGATNRNTSEYADTLIRSALNSLNLTDPIKGHCDYYDQHLYRDLYGIPDDLNWFKNIMNDYTAFSNKPIICTEYGGPLSGEFMTDDSINQMIIPIVQADPCLVAGDMQGFGLPDHYRMFAYGIEPFLEAKRDTIQGNNYVQRTMLALANGVERLYWWSLESNWHLKVTAIDSCYIKGEFAKLALIENDFNNEFISPDTSYYFYQNFSRIFKNISNIQQDSSYLAQDIYYFNLTNTANDTLYVIWEKRDQFYGAYEMPTNLNLNMPWECVRLRTVFGRDEVLTVNAGLLNVDLKDSPLIFSKCDNSTGVSKIRPKFFEIFPNPSNNFVWIKTNNDNLKIEVEIYDLSGRLLIRSTSRELDVSSFKKGVYIIKVKSGIKYQQFKLIKE